MPPAVAPRKPVLPEAAACPIRRACLRRGGRVVDRVGLENRSPCKRTVGSNPTLSATRSFQASDFTKFLVISAVIVPTILPTLLPACGERPL